MSIKRIGTSLSGMDIMAINIICRKTHKLHDKEEKEKHDIFAKSHDKTFHGHGHA